MSEDEHHMCDAGRTCYVPESLVTPALPPILLGVQETQIILQGSREDIARIARVSSLALCSGRTAEEGNITIRVK